MEKLRFANKGISMAKIDHAEYGLHLLLLEKWHKLSNIKLSWSPSFPSLYIEGLRDLIKKYTQYILQSALSVRKRNEKLRKT